MHGGKLTMMGYTGKSEEDRERHLEFFRNMKYYHIDEKKRLFIHAGYTSMHGPESEHHESSYIWDRTLLEVALAMDPNLKTTSIRYPKRLKHFSEIYIGHTPTQNYGYSQPINAANLWDIDTGAAFKGKLTAIDVENKEIWQSDHVYLLYPNENGRNRI